MSNTSVNNLQNVYDIRHERNLYHIIETTDCDCTRISGKVAVIISLFYMDTYKRYIPYIDAIDDNIDIYVVSPNDELLVLIDSTTKRDITTVKKINRGRDISALLVASKHIFAAYDYVCFVHDKRKKFDEQAEDSEFWIYNMWENTISSKGYVNRILNLFEENSNLGLLLPPEPIGEYINCWYINKWSSNYENTVQLCKKLGVDAKLSKDIPPIAFGTVFWCRTVALRKLMDYPWKYEDFKEEPLHFDGEINHAIERILPYVAQDAGYEAHMVMTDEYAVKLMSKSQIIMQRAFSVLNSELGIRYAFELNLLQEKKKEIQAFCSRYGKIYIYGIGERSKDAICMLKNLNIHLSGFVVSKKIDNNEFMGKKVLSLNEFCDETIAGCGIIIATNQINGIEIEKKLVEKGIVDYMHFT